MLINEIYPFWIKGISICQNIFHDKSTHRFVIQICHDKLKSLVSEKDKLLRQFFLDQQKEHFQRQNMFNNKTILNLLHHDSFFSSEVLLQTWKEKRDEDTLMVDQQSNSFLLDDDDEGSANILSKMLLRFRFL